MMDNIRHSVPGLASGRLRQVLFGIPHYFWELSRLRSRRDYHRWLYYKLPYFFDLENFPPVITLSVTMRCNFKCLHCFRNIMRWEPRDMEMPLFKKIVDELAMHPECILKIGGLGEPAIHPQIREFLFLLTKKKVRTIIYTNGTLLQCFSPQEIVELMFSKLVISIDGIDSQTYESRRVGGNYAKLKMNVAALYQTRTDLKRNLPKIEIRHVIFPNESRKNLDQFKEDWLPFADTVMFNPLHNVYAQPQGVSAPLFSRCRQIRREFYIGSGGQVPICGDQLWRGTTNEIIGDLHGSTIQELWKHPRLQHIRKCHEDSTLNNLPFCKSCKEITE